tara:strand:- start:2116 stop:3003 length:888 start_codon:yes stop_codon:yes gene_type:complete
MKVLTLGKGFVSEHLPYICYADKLLINNLYSSKDDSSKSFENFINEYKPDAIVNCIGRTGTPNIDWCESNQEDTYLTNVTLPSILASICAKHDIHFIQIGSGCIFSGVSPNSEYITSKYKDRRALSYIKRETGWKESDEANPKSYYSKTKYACDLIIGSLKNVTTLRIRMPLSTKNNPRNFINKVKGYDKIIDIPNSVTFMDDFVRCVDWAIKEQKTGIFHVTNPDPISAVQTMIEYQKYIPDHKFSIINEKELDKITIAKRSNCILNTDKLSAAGFNMTPSKDALKECMLNYFK